MQECLEKYPDFVFRDISMWSKSILLSNSLKINCVTYKILKELYSTWHFYFDPNIKNVQLIHVINSAVTIIPPTGTSWKWNINN